MTNYTSKSDKSEVVEPPYSNTGAQNTERRDKEVLIDWLSFTIPDDSVQDIKELTQFLCLPYDECVDRNGGHGYLKRLIYGNIHLYYEGSPGMGYHVSFTGKGCREYESIINGDWLFLFKKVLEGGGHFTRIDSAIDDYAQALDLNLIQEKVNHRHLVSRFKTTRTILSKDLVNEGSTGLTIIFGSRSSNAVVRMYDKGIEQGVDFNWIRCELELKHELANEFISKLHEGWELGKATAAVLKNYINFKDPSSDTNKSRWLTSCFWDEFLDGVSRLALTVKVAERTIEKTKEWLERQVAVALARVVEHDGGDLEFIDYLIDSGHKRLRFKESNIPIPLPRFL